MTTSDPRDPKTPVSIHTFTGGATDPERGQAAGTDKLEVPINEKNVLLREVSNFWGARFPRVCPALWYCIVSPLTITCLTRHHSLKFLTQCVLRNTQQAYAVVINTGVDTKLMKSSTESRVKVSDLDKEINKTVIVFFIMIILCLIGAGIIAIDMIQRIRGLKLIIRP